MRTHRFDRDANTFFSALSSAIHHDSWTRLAADAPPIDSNLDFSPENIRQTIVQFAIDHCMDRFDLLDGISIKDAVRSTYVTSPSPALLHTADSQFSPISWREWHQAMIRPDTFADPIITKVAALAFKLQIVFIDENGSYHIMNADNSSTRLFMRIEEFTYFHWAHLDSQRCLLSTCASTLSITVPAEKLDFNISTGLQRPPSLASSVTLPHHEQWLHAAHCGYTGHPGIEATVQLLRNAGHDWIGITKDARAFIRKCPTCTLARIRHNPALTCASMLRITDKPLSRWHGDHCDLPRCTHTGYKAILVFVDEVTGLTWLTGSRHKAALEVTVSLISLSSMFNAPEQFHTDGGPEFDNSVVQQFTAVTGIKHTFSIARVPNSNGIAERNVATSSHFVRSLCLDFGRINCWGLLLGLIIHAINSLPRHALGGASPNDFVFASFRSAYASVIPTVYSPYDGSIFDDINAPHIATNFAERALCAQQIITNKICEYYDSLFHKSAANPPLPAEQLRTGQQVLIDWTGETNSQPASKLHPLYRGPYVILSVHNNTLQLLHAQTPPPPNQPARLAWSTHARVFICEHDLDRSALDPAASQSALSSSSFGIECILTHALISQLPSSITSRPDYSSWDVRHQLYQVRYYFSSAPGFVRTAWRSYEDIAHTIAMDNYVDGQPNLHSHQPIASMPSTWSPLIPQTGSKPKQPPVPLSERHLVPPKKVKAIVIDSDNSDSD